MKEILNSHNLKTLRAEVKKTNIKGYSTMKKAVLINKMLEPKHRDNFKHIKMAGKKVVVKKATPKPKPKPAPKPKQPLKTEEDDIDDDDDDDDDEPEERKLEKILCIKIGKASKILSKYIDSYGNVKEFDRKIDITGIGSVYIDEYKLFNLEKQKKIDKQKAEIRKNAKRRVATNFRTSKLNDIDAKYNKYTRSNLEVLINIFNQFVKFNENHEKAVERVSKDCGKETGLMYRQSIEFIKDNEGPILNRIEKFRSPQAKKLLKDDKNKKHRVNNYFSHILDYKIPVKKSVDFSTPRRRRF